MAENALDRVSRLLDLVPWIMNNQGASISELASQFGVPDGQIEDDLNLLFVCGLPGYLPDDLIDLSFDDGFVVVSNPQKFNHPRKMSAAEISSAQLSLELLKSLSDEDTKTKISQIQEKFADSFKDALEIEVISTFPDDTIFQNLRAIISKAQSVSFTYISAHQDSKTDRQVLPIAIKVAAGKSFLLGYEYESEKVKNFRLDRISNLKSEPARAEISTHARSTGHQDQVITLVISKRLLEFLEENSDLILSEIEDGDGIQIEFRSIDEDWTIRKIRSYAGEIRVLGPAEFKSRYLERVKATLAVYS